jgi:type II pantothenate kinase
MGKRKEKRFMLITGLDCGITRTKIVSIDNGEIVRKETHFGLPETGGLGLFALSGVNAQNSGSDLIIPEFEAAAAGLRELTGESDFLAVILGTGTPFLRVSADGFTHIGGTGVGGGTVTGLCELLTGENDFQRILKLSEKGNAAAINLMVSDVLKSEDPLLGSDVTACNFGKISPEAGAPDKAAAVFSLVFEAVFVMAALAQRGDEKIVVAGGLSTAYGAEKTAAAVGAMHGKTFVFPKDREYCNAIGTAICGMKIITERGNKDVV